ncbi:Dyp-type peroxidase [Corynebacterium sp. sy017]|uniref:Dyp-type peroxidase n=1 Tax=unclassified Corynebacterium TaxID=2624378 RepID=UPI0011868A70|nr:MULTISPECIES: Dyp-type peroxidase [unclassified Corynebacterium]MBP3088718.1 Dyp-type peroxidase [Corynebacterium sp. sy017]QDZ43482.1 Dyp-type peroxidase [Corynebacterium sp. sy039]TSD92112.1 Dyp-type peroxidase [Corynebacterium sp. SY003]
MPQHDSNNSHSGGFSLSRRQLLAGLGGAGVGALGTGALELGHIRKEHSPTGTIVPFRGAHQSGIITPAQQQMLMVAFDMTVSRKQDLISLLTQWTTATERMMNGEEINTPKVRDDVPPDDTGETMGQPPASLSVTFGFGASLFEHPQDGDRFGIAHKIPAALRAGIPRMAAEKIDPDRSDGDIVIQICAEDPMVVLHAAHQYKRIAFGLASVKWMQLGYGRTSSTSQQQHTPRNLFGFKDGTANIKAEEDPAQLNEHLWIQPGDDQHASWAAGGTYLCIRKIAMMMEVWDELSLREQERIIGRDKLEGAPLSGKKEHDKPDFHALATEDMAPGTGGAQLNEPLINVNSHVATVHPENNGGHRMLRRGYNYTEGINELGRFNAGLFFIAFVRDPRTKFIPILENMATDLLTEYVQHIATGLYVVPPGIADGDDYIGQSLFD